MTPDLKTITDQIDNALNSAINPANKAQVTFKLNRLTLMLAASCQAVAWAERVYNRKLSLVTEANIKLSIPATEKKQLFAGSCRQELYYLTLAERQNKALVHALDALQAMLFDVG